MWLIRLGIILFYAAVLSLLAFLVWVCTFWAMEQEAEYRKMRAEAYKAERMMLKLPAIHKKHRVVEECELREGIIQCLVRDKGIQRLENFK